MAFNPVQYLQFDYYWDDFIVKNKGYTIIIFPLKYI